MRTIAAITVGMLCLVLAGCKTGTAEERVERQERAIFANAEVRPTIIARTSAHPPSVYKLMELVSPYPRRAIGDGFGYTVSEGGWPYSFYTCTYIVVKPWGTGTEFRLWSDSDTPKFELKDVVRAWNAIDAQLNHSGARFWMVYPPDPEGKYASKNWSVPEPGSPDLSLK